MALTVKHFNTWAGSLSYEHRPDYWKYIWEQSQAADILHMSEVHSCTDDSIPDFVMPEDKGHREGPLSIRQLQYLERLLRNTHDVYFEPQITGLHDLDGSHSTVQYGNVTCVKKGLLHDLSGGITYRTFNCLNDQSEGGKPASKSIQSVFVLQDGTWYQSMSLHGHWDKRGKIDTPERRVQFVTAMSFTASHRESNLIGEWADARLIVGGDFNVTSECEVLNILRDSKPFPEEGGIILNHEFANTDGTPLSTRTKWYPKEKPNREANFIIVDPDVHVAFFALDCAAPSDHCMITTVLA